MTIHRGNGPDNLRGRSVAAVPGCCRRVKSPGWVRRISQGLALFEAGDVIVANSPGAYTAIKPEVLEHYVI